MLELDAREIAHGHTLRLVLKIAPAETLTPR
jgi:hypothetical protein